MKLGALILCVFSSCPPEAVSTKIIEAQHVDVNLTVNLGYAAYQGSKNASTSINSWLGMRYAAPPIGSLRFQAPQDPIPEPDPEKTIPAESFTSFAQCPQAGLTAPQDDVGSEDCLFLSVQSPSNASNLPVFVWIHGGGFQNGNGKIDFSPLILEGDSSFIVVSIQYRLNAFGFLSSPDVKNQGTLNAGLLDQKRAFEWVQQYIRLFGGDPDRVTLGGESAGSASIYYHTTALSGTLGTSLWTGSILSSAAVVKPYHFTDAQVVRPYYRLVNAMGCLASQRAFDCIVGAPFPSLQNASNAISISEIYAVPPFTPVVDEDMYLLSSPSEQLQHGPINGAFTLVGNQANEGADFVPVPSLPNLLFPSPINTTESLQTYVQYVFPLLTPELVRQVLAHYNPETFPTHLSFPDELAESIFQEIAINIVGEAIFYCPSQWLAFSSQKAWRYQFSIPPALHASDLSIYEPINVTGYGNPGQNISENFRSAFLSTWNAFINDWDPATSIVSHKGVVNSSWPLYTPREPLMMNFNTSGATMELTYALGTAELSQAIGGQNNFTLINEANWQGGRGVRCDFWRSLGSLLPA